VPALIWRLSPAKHTMTIKPQLTPEEIDKLEVDTLIEAVYLCYGLDFRDYARASIYRRIRHRLEMEKLPHISALQDKVLHDLDCMARLLQDLSVNTTSMFRDPSFFLALRTQMVPRLRTYPFVRIWCAGVSSGEEAYSLAILLQEEGLLDKTRIYATDFNQELLSQAKDGIFPLDKMQEFTKNYQKAGGTRSLGDYYTARFERARFKPALAKNIVFAQHNLVTDASFNEFHLILCRNVMIYFNRQLQNRVHHLIYDSLVYLGYLGLGDKESIRYTAHAGDYEEVNVEQKLYRKIK
jgi:chemotaxis protein methyltransferase CheR